MVALIDADIVAYRAASVSQDDIEWNDGSYGLTLNSQQAKNSAQHIIRDWREGSRQLGVVLCWSSENNFRKEIDPNYKANRKGDKPELLNEVTEWMKNNYESYSVERLEADDVMGIYHTAGVTDTVIVSIDKDMQTIPGMLFNPDKDRAPRRISVEQADRFWMLQTLMGDRVDGIPGIQGVGPKKAEKILSSTRSNLPNLWSTVVSAYEDAGLTQQDALLNARLTHILRAEDYNRNEMEISLWHPTTPTPLSLIIEEASNPSTSSTRKTSASRKETSSSTSVDGEERVDSKTSSKRKRTSNVSSRKKKPQRKKHSSTTSVKSMEVNDEVA